MPWDLLEVGKAFEAKGPATELEATLNSGCPVRACLMRRNRGRSSLRSLSF